MIYWDTEHRDGFYIYIQHDMISLTTVKWFIPEELNNNEIVRTQMDFKPFDKLFAYIGSIQAYNIQLNNLHLDIERKSIQKKKTEIKEKCYRIIEKMNKGLSPYHWEMEKSLMDRETYLIELRRGENWFLRKIQDM